MPVVQHPVRSIPGSCCGISSAVVAAVRSVAGAAGSGGQAVAWPLAQQVARGKGRLSA